MSDSLSLKVIGRFVAFLFIFAGLAIIAHLPFPKPPNMDRQFLFLLGLVTITMGVGVRVLPWERLPRYSLLLLVPPVFALMSAGSYYGKVDGFYYGIHYALVFIAMGIAYPRGTSLLILPPAVLAYVTPLLIEDRPSWDVWSVAWVIPVCVLVGESLAWVANQLRFAQVIEGRRVTDMATLVDATVALSQQDDPRAVADLAARHAVDLLHGDAAIVLLVDRSGDLIGSGGFRWQKITESVHVVPGTRAVVDEAMATGRVAVESAVESAVGSVSEGVGLTNELGVDAVMALPMGARDAPIGVLVVAFAKHGARFDGFTLNLADTFATQVTLAFARLQAIRILLNESLRDELTGLGNRRQISKALELLDPGDAVVLIDLDHFKSVNDVLGHLAGDDVLRRFGTFLAGTVREVDIVARYGGEEFLMVLPGVGEDGGAAVKRMASAWRATSPEVTFSAGVSIHRAGQSSAATLSYADRALYEAKSAGRDCVRTYGSDLTAGITA